MVATMPNIVLSLASLNTKARSMIVGIAENSGLSALMSTASSRQSLTFTQGRLSASIVPIEFQVTTPLSDRLPSITGSGE